MSENRFTIMFKRHGWEVKELGENSFVAYNKNYFIPFSCIPIGCDDPAYVSAVSYFIKDMEPFIKEWESHAGADRVEFPIGFYAYGQWFNETSNFAHQGEIANHDQSVYEIESWLERIEQK